MDKLREDLFYVKKDLLVQNTDKAVFEDAVNIICSRLYNNMEYIFSTKNLFDIKEKDNLKIIPDAALLWGERATETNMELIDYAFELKLPVFVAENSFVRSAYSWNDRKVPEVFSDGVSFIIDKYAYFDAINISQMEKTLEDSSFHITEEQKKRARNCINKIVENKLTKYNHQPIYEPKIGTHKRKVLVVDQTYRDMAIVKGLANDSTFSNMLQSAIRENPDSDIIVKTHPDVAKGAIKGYYQGLKSEGNLYFLTEPINPVSLINYCDSVYVCSSQFGFEALMCGKEVHTFGMPFYAGWGLTKDRINFKRRTTQRSLEEVFYVAYIMYSYWVNPKKKCRCEIEEALDYIIELRKDLFIELEKIKEQDRKRKQKLFEDLKNSSHKIVLWGASLFLEDFVKQFDIENENILGVIDKNPDKQGSFLGKHQIFKPEELKELKPDEIIITIVNSSEEREKEIKEFLNINNLNNIKVKRI